MSYEYRSSDLDFALFLVDLTPAQVIPERWHEPHPQVVDARMFAHSVMAVESMVSPDVRKFGRRARFRNGSVLGWAS